MRVIWGEGLTDESNLGGSNQTYTNNVEKNRSGYKGSIRKKGIFIIGPTIIRVDKSYPVGQTIDNINGFLRNKYEEKKMQTLLKSLILKKKNSAVSGCEGLAGCKRRDQAQKGLGEDDGQP